MGGKGTYFVKNSSGGTFEDITEKYKGVAILKVDGLNELGEPVNIFTEQYVNSQREDFLIAGDKVVRKNVDIQITFLVKQKYAPYTINVLTVHDAFIDYMTKKDIWVKSVYSNKKAVHCVCLKSYKPTTTKLDRGTNSYMLGTITLHALDEPEISV